MDDIQKFKVLKEEIQALSDSKIRIEERFKNEKEQLEKLLAEINAKGYDPKKLKEIREEKEALLKQMLEELELNVKETQEKLNKIEA